MSRTGGPFYGWAIVGAVFVTMAVGAGLGFYNTSVILSAAVDELDAEVGAVSGATGLFFGLAGIIAFVFAPLMDRVDMRWFFLVGGTLGAAALYGLQWVDSVPDLYVFFAVFSVGFALAGIVPGTTLVARWFSQRRSLALSIASTGLSVGGVLITPIVARRIIDDGMAATAPAMAAAWILGIVPISLLVLRSYPSDKGLEPDGAPVTSESSAPIGATFSQAIANRFFRLVSITYALIFFAQVGGIAQLFNHVSERLDEDIAAVALSTLALSSIIGRLVGGVVVLRVDARLVTLLLSIVQGVALILVGVAETRFTMLAGSVVFGISIGNLLMLQPLLLAEAFGVKAYSRIFSFCSLIGTVGIASGPFVLGLIRDAADYRTAFIAAAIANAVGLVTMFAAGSSDVPQKLWRPVSGLPANEVASAR